MTLYQLEQAKTIWEVFYALKGMGPYVSLPSTRTDGRWGIGVKRRPFKRADANINIFLWEKATRILQKKFNFTFNKPLREWRGIYDPVTKEWITPPKPLFY